MDPMAMEKLIPLLHWERKKLRSFFSRKVSRSIANKNPQFSQKRKAQSFLSWFYIITNQFFRLHILSPLKKNHPENRLWKFPGPLLVPGSTQVLHDPSCSCERNCSRIFVLKGKKETEITKKTLLTQPPDKMPESAGETRITSMLSVDV